MGELKTLGDWIFDDLHTNKYLRKLYSGLMVKYTRHIFNVETEIGKKELIALLRFADLLSKTNDSLCEALNKNIAQNIITVLSKIYPNSDEVKYYMGSILTNVNNYVGLSSQCKSYKNVDILENFAEEFEKSIHKLPSEFEEEIFFNHAQRIAYDKMGKIKFYSFSGPTSMGKTFLMKTFIRHKIIQGVKANFVIVVPTKALINEIKREMIEYIANELKEKSYKVITTSSVIKDYSESNYVMIYTQERLLYHMKEYNDLSIDYLFIDEAQKISEVGLRSAYFYKVVGEAIKINSNINILFSSPNIPNPDLYFELLPKNLDEHKESDTFLFSPVNQHKCIIDDVNNKIRIFNDLSLEFEELALKKHLDLNGLLSYIGNQSSNIVFCDSRNDVIEFSKAYYDCCEDIGYHEELKKLIADIKSEIHPKCYLIQFLERGISYHVGYLPATIKEQIETLYRKKIIKTIFCTSTLIEGVNLPADNLIIAIKKSSYILRKPASFKNLVGRVGRKTYNLVGNVFILPVKDGTAEVVDKCVSIIKEPVDEQKLSIEIVLTEGLKEEIISKLLVGDTILDKKKLSYDEYDLARYAINVLVKSILNHNYDNKIYSMFENLLNQENLSIIEGQFQEKSNITDDSNVTQDQIVSIDQAIIKQGLSYPRDIDYQSILSFLNRLHELFNWGKYESKLGVGKKERLKYYAVILNQWMHGESINQIIQSSIKHCKNKSKIYNNSLNKEEDYIGSYSQINQIIVECLSTIENIVLYSISNYFMKFSERYKFLSSSESINNDWSEYIDFGTNDDLVISLQKIGLSREVAKVLMKNEDAYLNENNNLIILKRAFKNPDERVIEELELTKVNFSEIFKE